jgi:SAM-dependent methyltransferase
LRNKTVNRDYWEKNIGRFSGFYDKQSEEKILAPGWLSFFYKKLLFPIEKKFMYDRYRMVSEYIEENVHPGMTVADIGCGSGIFVKMMVAKGAKVYALDYTQAALDLVKQSLTEEEIDSVEMVLLDIAEQSIPSVDLALSIGVLTYIEDADQYFNNILPFTKKFLFNYLDSGNPLNMLRKVLKLLDVRRLTYHDPHTIRQHLAKRNFDVDRIQRLATGFMVSSSAKP